MIVPLGGDGGAAYLGAMSDATISGVPPVARERPGRTASVELPKPQPFGAPVFVTDAVTPLAGETVLSLLWKRLARDDTDPRG